VVSISLLTHSKPVGPPAPSTTSMPLMEKISCRRGGTAFFGNEKHSRNADCGQLRLAAGLAVCIAQAGQRPDLLSPKVKPCCQPAPLCYRVPVNAQKLLTQLQRLVVGAFGRGFTCTRQHRQLSHDGQVQKETSPASQLVHSPLGPVSRASGCSWACSAGCTPAAANKQPS
jgi:hypothetical protein